jgi:hypothetical protein
MKKAIFLMFFTNSYALFMSGQNKIVDIDACICFYLNRLEKNDNFVNYGIYNKAVMEYLEQPDVIYSDNILFFSAHRTKKAFLERKIRQNHLFDIPDLTWDDASGIRKILSGDSRSDSIEMLNSVIKSTKTFVSRYDFDIVSWIDRRPLFYSTYRLSKKKGIYIKCSPITATWYLAKYPDLTSKLNRLVLSQDEKKPEYIRNNHEILRVSFKDSTIIAYPLTIKK